MTRVQAGRAVRVEVSGAPSEFEGSIRGTAACLTAAPRPRRELGVSRCAAVRPAGGLVSGYGVFRGWGWGR